MPRWSVLVLPLVLAGCTATGLTRTSDPLRCVAFVTPPEDHHGFLGAGATRAALASGDTLTVWAMDPVGEWRGSEDSLAFYLQPGWGTSPRVFVAPSDVRSTEREWHPARAYYNLSIPLLGTGGAVGGGLLLADEDGGWEVYAGMAGGALVGFALATFGPEAYRRVDRCEVSR